jgi:hypothetical protein
MRGIYLRHGVVLRGFNCSSSGMLHDLQPAMLLSPPASRIGLLPQRDGATPLFPFNLKVEELA